MAKGTEKQLYLKIESIKTTLYRYLVYTGLHLHATVNKKDGKSMVSIIDFYVLQKRPQRGLRYCHWHPPYGATLSNSEKRIYRIVYPETQFKIDTYSLFILAFSKSIKKE